MKKDLSKNKNERTPRERTNFKNTKILRYNSLLNNISYQLYCNESHIQSRIFSKVIPNISNFNKQTEMAFNFDKLSIDQCSPDHWVNWSRIWVVCLQILLFSIQVFYKESIFFKVENGSSQSQILPKIVFCGVLLVCKPFSQRFLEALEQQLPN